MNTAIIIATRAKSSRVPGKPFVEIEGVPLIERLYDNIKASGVPVIFAYPEEDKALYQELLSGLRARNPKWQILSFMGFPHDPLGRLNAAAHHYGVKNVVRITHDKVFVDQRDLMGAVKMFEKEKCDYLYSSHFVAGSAFEIMSAYLLAVCASRYKNVEFVSYAARSTAQNQVEYYPQHRNNVNQERFLVDFPEDVQFLRTLYACTQKDLRIDDAILFCRQNPWVKKINELPRVTVYTCCHNGKEHLRKAVESVLEQKLVGGLEYILIDDASADGSSELMSYYAATIPEVKYVRQSENRGLAASSNRALDMARGKWIIRLDADDYFLSPNSVQFLVEYAEQQSVEAVYPQNYYGADGVIQLGQERHHVGGSLFLTRAMQHFRFNERLRHYEGLDFFGRAKDHLKIGYYHRPTFFYRQSPTSMSNSEPEKRVEIRETIRRSYGV